MTVLIHAVGRAEVPPLAMPDRFRRDVTYFMTPSGDAGVPQLSAGEFWVRQEDARRWLDELVILVISPLDSSSKAEVELTDEQEAWLEWLVQYGVEHLRIEG